MISMTEKEEELFNIIKENPQISQNELAVRLGITRSSVSVHINNLSKKGYIVGRGYVLNEMDYVTVIGAANIDILGFPAEKLIHHDSNPGSVEICNGGVGRNTAENLARLNIDTKFITALGDDRYGQNLLEDCRRAGINMDHCCILKGGLTSMYVAIMEENRRLELALSDMNILDNLPEQHIVKKAPIIGRSKIIVLDAAIPRKVIEYILANFNKNRIFLSPISVGKVKTVKDLIGSFDTLMVNRLESEYLTGKAIESWDDLERTTGFFIDKGVKNVYLTLGKNGVYYSNGTYSGYFKPREVEPVNETGASDAFMAGIVYCSLEGKDMDYTARFASAMSEMTLKSLHSVSTTISVDNVQRIMAEESFELYSGKPRECVG